ncbi:CheR family methyltransferase [Natronospora cellulosivora (SeqCode)]
MNLNFDDFKNRATEILNLNLSGYKIKRVKRRTDSLMRRHEIKDYSECLDLLENNQKFKAAYLDHFTINTSEFFRNPENFKYLEEKILAELFSKKQKIKIWSAPCSNGSEPYTISILLDDGKYQKDRYQILASDLDVNILNAAKNGLYNSNAVQNVPDNLLKKYFTEVNEMGKKFKLSKKIINNVSFEKKDLINESFEKGWDLILSRNFFIYLTNDIKEELTRKFANALNPGSYLFLGNTEFIFNPQEYGLEKVFSSFYKKKE